MSAVEIYAGAVRTPGGRPKTRDILIVGEEKLPNAVEVVESTRLMKMMGLSYREYSGLWRTQLCKSSWDSKEAIHRSMILLGKNVPWIKIICLGPRASRCMRGPRVIFESSRIDQGERTFEILYLPCLSGIFVWEDPESCKLALNALINLEPQIPWGVSP